MKNNLILGFSLIIVFTQAQTHRFIYDVEYKKDSTSELTTKENYHLDIKDNFSKYYTRDYYLADSLINNNIPFPVTLKLDTSSIITHSSGLNDFSEYDLLEGTVLNLQSSEKQIWTLFEEHKTENNIKMQKAGTNWGGRSWTAWFASEIPFQSGPHKFHGLPGLIIELFDSKGNYKFQLIKSENLVEDENNQFLQMAEKLAVPVTWEKFKLTKLKYYDSPVNFLQNANGLSSTSQFYLNDGTIVKVENRREINNQLRNKIKKYNNPIDLSKAISYP